MPYEDNPIRKLISHLLTKRPEGGFWSYEELKDIGTALLGFAPFADAYDLRSKLFRIAGKLRDREGIVVRGHKRYGTRGIGIEPIADTLDTFISRGKVSCPLVCRGLSLLAVLTFGLPRTSPPTCGYQSGRRGRRFGPLRTSPLRPSCPHLANVILTFVSSKGGQGGFLRGIGGIPPGTPLNRVFAYFFGGSKK